MLTFSSTRKNEGTPMDSIQSLYQSIKEGSTTPINLLDKYLERIKQIDPIINAWEYLDPQQAKADAIKATKEINSGFCRGRLHGIPIGIKDIIDVNDWPTRAGCMSWARSFARQDATIVTKLRKAGAILVGKTVTTAYASFDPPPTRNPWNLQKTPGGSSSGSAAAVSAGMIPAALGTQTGGSITRPASYCGVASIKPTFGWISLDGVLPLAQSMDHMGMMAPKIEDLEIIWEEVTETTNRIPEAPKPPCIAVLKSFFSEKASDEMRNMLNENIKNFQRAGAQVAFMELPEAFANLTTEHRAIMSYEAFKIHEYWISRRPEDYPPKITSLIKEGSKISPDYYISCKNQQNHWKNYFEKNLKEHDCFLMPATTTEAPDNETTGDPAFNSPWSFTGLPALSLPCQLSKTGLPLAIQLVSRSNSEPKLFQLGKWCEKQIDYSYRCPNGLNKIIKEVNF
ncbi:MAG: amidase [Planctomycetes bacterium]|nr:amidase [Planctomycetota bacterium]